MARRYTVNEEWLFAQMAARLDRMGGILSCNKCGRSFPLGPTVDYLMDAWPRCCDTTMVWTTAKELAGGKRPSPHRWRQ